MRVHSLEIDSEFKQIATTVHGLTVQLDIALRPSQPSHPQHAGQIAIEPLCRGEEESGDLI